MYIYIINASSFRSIERICGALEENKGGQLEENKFEQRVFQLPGKGSVEEENNRLRVTWKLSANEPTGIYAEPNEEITIDIKERSLSKLLLERDLMMKRTQRSLI